MLGSGLASSARLQYGNDCKAAPGSLIWVAKCQAVVLVVARRVQVLLSP